MTHTTTGAENRLNGCFSAQSSRLIRVETSQLISQRLDQFYTLPPLAANCFKIVQNHYDLPLYQLVDPSAGDGAFCDIMPEDRIAIDAEPKGPNIIRGDYLKTEVLSARPIIVAGNPPFGKCSSLAIAFFKHAARSAEVIAFILPRTACKASFVRRLPLNWHMVYEELSPDKAFLANSQICSVPTIWQIWERRNTLRVMPPVRTSHPHFGFTTRKHADFEIQRIGAYAGRIRHQSGAKKASLLFVKARHPDAERNMSKIDFSDCTNNNAGNPCLSMEEIVVLYEDLLVGRFGRYQRPLAPLLPGASHSCHCCGPHWPFA